MKNLYQLQVEVMFQLSENIYFEVFFLNVVTRTFEIAATVYLLCLSDRIIKPSLGFTIRCNCLQNISFHSKDDFILKSEQHGK